MKISNQCLYKLNQGTDTYSTPAQFFEEITAIL